jgi:hypothetical protein
MNHSIINGKFYWVFRYEDDKLGKGKNKWLGAIDEILPTKNLKEFKEDDFHVSGRGVAYKDKMRVIFISLQEFQATDSAFDRNAIHLVFEEAMPSDYKQLENPDEETRWGQILANVWKPSGKPTECYFLCNPHTKGIWFLNRFCRPEWLAEAFTEDEKEHFFEGELVVEFEGQLKPVPILLFQAPEREDENTFMLNMVKNDLRRQRGTFPKEVDQYICERPKDFKRGIPALKQIMLLKDCIYARLNWNDKRKAENQIFYFFKRSENEPLDPDISHLCLSMQEYNASPHRNKFLANTKEEIKHWTTMFFYSLEAGQLFFCDPEAYEAKRIILQFTYQFEKFGKKIKY